MRFSVFFLNHSHTASFTFEYCEELLRFFALENPLSYSSLTRVFCFRMLLTCVFPQPNFSANLPAPVNPLLFSYSSTFWKRFSKGNSFLAFRLVLSFGVISMVSPIEHSPVSQHACCKRPRVNLTCTECISCNYTKDFTYGVHFISHMF